MKDYIYVDTDLATSYFAQMNQGAITSFLSTTETRDESEQNGGKEVSKKAKIGASFVAKAEGEISAKQIDTYTQAFMKNNSETVENVLHDYLIDILIKSIPMEPLEVSKDGDFVLCTGKIKIYDFELSRESVTTDVMKHIFSLSDNSKEDLKKLEDLEKKSRRSKLSASEQHSILEIKNNLGITGGEIAEGAFQILDRLFPDTILIKINNTISLCDKNKFRFLRNHLSPLNSTTKEITVFGRILSKVNGNEAEVPSESLELLSKASTIFPEIITSSFKLKKDGDYNLRPIAIYFE